MMTTLISLRLRSSGLGRRTVGTVLLTAALTAGASPWENMSTGLFNEAHAEFIKEEKAPSADARTLRFGEAVSLINVQPRTEANIDRAYSILEELHTANSSDDIGIESRYFQGRIEQVQRPAPDLAKAEGIFSELIQAHPGHAAGQRARVKLAVIRLYAKIDPAERRRRYEEFSQSLAQLTDPGAQLQLNLLLGEVVRRFSYGNANELTHMLAAYKAGVTKRRLLVDVLLRIGDLARLEGHNDIAREYYTRFLEQFPRTDRRSTVENYLVELNKKTS